MNTACGNCHVFCSEKEYYSQREINERIRAAVAAAMNSRENSCGKTSNSRVQEEPDFDTFLQ